MTTWVDSFKQTGTGDFDGWNGYTCRNIYTSAQLSNVGQTFVRVTFYAANAQALTLNAAYIGQQADSGDAYDFQATPVQLLYSGGASFVISAAGNLVSDPATFSIPAGKGLVISWQCNAGTSNDNARAYAASGYSNYYKNAQDASTVNATGYSLDGTARILASLRIESGSNVNSGMFLAFMLHLGMFLPVFQKIAHWLTGLKYERHGEGFICWKSLPMQALR